MQHWVCSQEKHQHGGDHYYVALKLTAAKRWKPVKDSKSSPEGFCSAESCTEVCEKEYYHCAREILQHNRINTYPRFMLMLLEIFSHAALGIQKHNDSRARKLCGKIYVETTGTYYHAFCYPANDEYAWFGAYQAEVIVHQHFRRSLKSAGKIYCFCWMRKLLNLHLQKISLSVMSALTKTNQSLLQANTR